MCDCESRGKENKAFSEVIKKYSVSVVIRREKKRTRLPVVRRAKSRRAVPRRRRGGRGGEGGGEGGGRRRRSVGGVGGETTAARAVTSIAILAPRNDCIRYAHRGLGWCLVPGACRRRAAMDTSRLIRVALAVRSALASACDLSPPLLFSLHPSPP